MKPIPEVAVIPQDCLLGIIFHSISSPRSLVDRLWIPGGFKGVV
jgi:hypothetical protein